MSTLPPEGANRLSDMTMAEYQQSFVDTLAQCEKDPLKFFPILGVKPWSKQVEIIESVWKYRQTYVPSCNAAGKTYIAAAITLAWMYSHNPQDGIIVAVFGQKFEKLQKGFWRELQTMYNSVHSRFKGTVTLGGKMQTHDFFPWPGQFDKCYVGIFGAKKENVENIQGTHAKHLLIISEEGSGLEYEILEAQESCLADDNNRLLIIRNPITLSGPFYDRCTDLKNPELKRKNLRNVIKISALETPNYVAGKSIFPGMAGRAWVEEERDKWGERSAYYQARVLGEFPQSAENAVFPLEIIEAACNRGDAVAEARRRGDLPDIIEDEKDKSLGWDIAREGKDKSVILSLWGNVVHGIRRKHTPNLELAKLWFMTTWKDWGGKVGVDANGLGGGPYDWLRVKKHECKAHGFISQRSAKKKVRFNNTKIEAAWSLRERMIETEFAIMPSEHRDGLKADLAGYVYDEDLQGRIRIVDPPRSPDCGDALIIAHWRQRCSTLGGLTIRTGGESISKTRDVY